LIRFWNKEESSGINETTEDAIKLDVNDPNHTIEPDLLKIGLL